MKKQGFYIILLILVFSGSCRKILFNDELLTREIYTGGFTAIKVSGMYNIILVQDSADMVEISGTNNTGKITATVENDTLIIDDGIGLSFNTAVNNITIHFTGINYMITHDPVNITCSDTLELLDFTLFAIGEISEASLAVKCRSLFVYNSANSLGYMYLRGKAGSVTLYNQYGSSIFAGDLSCTDAEIVNGSAGDVFINASDHLVAYIWGPGNIYYTGNPVISLIERKGTGKLTSVAD